METFEISPEMVRDPQLKKGEQSFEKTIVQNMCSCYIVSIQEQMFGGIVTMLKYTTYQSIYNNEVSAATSSSSWKPVERLRGLQMMFERRLFMKLVLAIMIMIAGGTGMVRVFAGSAHDEVPMEKVVVSKGDTLWEIAREYKPEGMDTRAYIQIIKKVNHLKSAGIEAGDVLSLPIY
ncbi:LysM peptidoglycan-binding domain-containing protein [Paenibacillus donghaensis]|uniref:cell division suppressor protein YneA n=1 Tax=Paenibacillus donghaensis TaxID=414771 RepID=UPI001883FC0E|nr:LysM peptidoglycan-binding domain-containing protein [Paenibacillus donghaensis]MBE9915749.1 LysM peptidoglycan-binding domain-containing protein [Paenibacillus donghaensis]